MPGDFDGVEEPEDDAEIIFKYSQDIPMPSYTIAFICGDLKR